MIFIILLIAMFDICTNDQIIQLKQNANEHDSFRTLHNIAHVSNIHASLTNDIAKALFILIQQHQLIVVILVVITQGNQAMIQVVTFIIQQAR